MRLPVTGDAVEAWIDNGWHVVTVEGCNPDGSLTVRFAEVRGHGRIKMERRGRLVVPSDAYRWPANVTNN